MLQESAVVDELEAAIIRCVQLHPRVPFALIATPLGVSEQTVARRYRSLVDAGILRVTAIVNPDALGQSSWIVRTRCRPSGANSLAQALAQRDDVSWVTVQSGGAEVFSVLRARTSESRDHLLMQRLPQSAPVLDMSALMVLHRFVGGANTSADDWTELADSIDADLDRLVRDRAAQDFPQPGTRASGVALTREDLTLLDALAQDGRAGYAALARAAGLEQGRATRRLRALLGSGAAYLDVDVSVEALGFATSACLWLTVPPAAIETVGSALAAEREIAFAAAVSGPQNITASVVCRDPAHLYAFVTGRIGAIAGVQALEICPTLRTVKQAGAMVSGDRLVTTQPG